MSKKDGLESLGEIIARQMSNPGDPLAKFRRPPRTGRTRTTCLEADEEDGLSVPLEPPPKEPKEPKEKKRPNKNGQDRSSDKEDCKGCQLYAYLIRVPESSCLSGLEQYVPDKRDPTARHDEVTPRIKRLIRRHIRERNLKRKH